MKNCERFVGLLSDYADSTMAPAEKSEFAAHLKECAECNSAAEGVVNLRQNLRRLPALQTSQDFETILRTRIKLDRRANMAPVWNMRYAGSRRVVSYSAAAALAMVCVFYLWQRLSANSLTTTPSSLTVSQMQIAPNQVLPSVSPAKILYTLDKVTPQLWPNLGIARKGAARPSSPVAKDSMQATTPARTGATPVSHQPITF
ncbi:MAG: zf-HC2 domain-containing protein [bacterium]